VEFTLDKLAEFAVGQQMVTEAIPKDEVGDRAKAQAARQKLLDEEIALKEKHRK
jgi:hypothetical protein